MTWTNAFDVGECTVKVNGGTPASEMFSAVMSKGTTSATFAGNFGETLFVVVDANGSVSLQSDDVTTWNTYALRVIPSYTIPSGDLRLSGITIDPNAHAFTNGIPFTNWIPGTDVSGNTNGYTVDAGPPATPDPAELRPNTDYGDFDAYTEFSMGIEGGG